ncbi:hypothetical protein BA3_0019 [Thalassomonas phage BA3]|uniref:terminase small subunit n=1 Tax=Thalassomonas phage BA3 TaxID=469660 RepID=UPI00015D9598|nr:terminase small subunit [Thalassomonas phage BA3]ABV74304.1 hypothetical protein BA3_0019 [Thalassomonas phage BA3]
MAKNKQISFTQEQMELASKLTPLQRKFVIELIKPNTTQRQAYITAGGKAKGDKAQDASASRMLTDVKVKAFYNSLMESRESEAIFDRNEALEIVAEIAKNQEVAPNHRVQAVKQASEMEGWNAPKKTELTGKDGEALQLKADVSAPEVAEALNNLMDKI